MRTVCMTVALCVAGLLCGSANAANSYEDLGGRFVIDLPDGWQLQPQTEKDVYIFKGEGYETIILEYTEKETDVELLLGKAVNTMRLSSPELTDAKVQGDAKGMKTNGNEAYWAVYAGEVSVGEIKVMLYCLAGAVSLDEDGVSVLSILNEASRTKLGDQLEKSFQSIRNVGQTASGVTDVKVVTITPVFIHDLMSAKLPPGWNANTLGSDFQKEVIGWYMSDSILGGNLLIFCYKGMSMNENEIFDAAKVSVESSMPNAKTVKNEKMELTNGKEALVTVYQGTRVAQGQEVSMTAVTAIRNVDNNWMCLAGFAHSDHGALLEKDILAIAGTAK